MARTKTKTAPAAATAMSNGAAGEVLTLSEAAAYLRITEEEVVRLTSEQKLPGRQIGEGWRFFKVALQEWLAQPVSTSKPKDIWSVAGSWKDDPYLEDMLKEIYARRGRPMPEEE